MAERIRARRRSERIAKRTTFCNFTNTKENPVDLEAFDENEIDNMKSGDKDTEMENVHEEQQCADREERTQGDHGCESMAEEHVDDEISTPINNDTNETVGILCQQVIQRLLESLNMNDLPQSGVKKNVQGSSRDEVDDVSISSHPTSRTRSSTIKDKGIVDDDRDCFSKELNISKSNQVTLSGCENKQSKVKRKIGSDCKEPVNLEKKELKTKRRKKTGDDAEPSGLAVSRTHVIRARTSPKSLHETIATLSQPRKDALEKIGLGSLLSMSVDGIPSKLGFFVVDSLDTRNMVLKVKDGEIPITIDSIHQVLGLPRGDIDLMDLDDDFFGLTITQVWKDQFGKPKTRPKDVMNLILRTSDWGLEFKLNFLVLFVNLLIECSSMGCCNISFMKRIKNEDMISQIDWCKFVYAKIKTSKAKWRRDNDLCFYCGPLTYLTLLYVESTLEKKVDVEDKSSPLSAWTMALLRKREVLEIHDGGIGKLELKAEFRLNVNSGDKDNLDDRKDEDELTEEQFISKIDVKLGLLKIIKLEVETLISESIRRFHDNSGVKRLQMDYECIIGNVQSQKTPIKASQETTAVANKDHVWDSPTFVAAVNDEVDRSVENLKIKKKLKEGGAPDFNLDKGKAPMITDDNEPKMKPIAKEIIELGGRGARRSQRLGDHLRSPFVVRILDMSVSNEEKRLHEWALAAFGSKSDIVYSTSSGPVIVREGIESLAAETFPFTSVIDAWADILNAEERFRARDSPRRYFLSTEIMYDSKMRMGLDIKTKCSIFTSKLKAASKNQENIFSMKDFDLVFFPMITPNHCYLVVFNLKNPAVVIIDNKYQQPMDDNDDLLQSYGRVTDTLQQLMINHLRHCGHPAGRELDEVGQERLVMDWQTSRENKSSVVFCMRHMECYLGHRRSWKTGLTSEGTKQVTQIANLRIKYVSKLLTHDRNLKKEFVLEEAKRYHELDPKMKANFAREAMVSRCDRLIK